MLRAPELDAALQVTTCVLRCCLSFSEICVVSHLVNSAEQSRNYQNFSIILHQGSFTEKSPAQPAAEIKGVAANFTCILHM